MATPTTLCDKVLSDLDLSPPIETWLTRLAAIKSVIGVVMGMKLDGTCARSDSNRRELHTKTDINGMDQGQGRGRGGGAGAGGIGGGWHMVR